MQKIMKLQKFIIIFLIFSSIFYLIYNTNKSYATIHFQIKVINSKTSQLAGQIYYSDSHLYHKDKMTYYLLRSNMYNKFQEVNIPVKDINIKYIRLDPLNKAGEVIIKDFSIIQGSWFNKKVQHINLDLINLKKIKDIKILAKDNNYLHLRAIKADPHLEITHTAHKLSHMYDYKKIFIIILVSLLISIILTSIIYGFIYRYLKGSELITAIILILYSTYTYLYAIHFNISEYLILFLPILGIFIIYQQGILNYIKYTKYSILILITLTIIVLVVDYMNDTYRIRYYALLLLDIILPAMFISMIFIQKKYFNYHFYKNFLTVITIFLGIFSILLHYDIIQIDRIITLGYRMSMSPWAQKNYTFWYLFLMWGTISFFHFTFKRKKDFFIIVFILFISTVAIFSGYSSSAQLAFIVSTFLYLLFSYVRINTKLLKLIPIFFSLYILFTPWISDIYVYLSDLHPRFQSRESIFEIYAYLIKEHLLFGYGFDNTASINPIDYLPKDLIVYYSDNPFLRSCVPHSVLLLLWLNLGLFGIILFTFLTYKSIARLLVITYNYNNQAALIALITSFMIIVSFSWGNWKAYSLLTFSFFMGMIFLSLNINHHKKLK